MSRYSPDIDREEIREERRAPPEPSLVGGGTSSELIAAIDEAAGGKPTFTQFLERLCARGVEPVPSVNQRGLNGMSYVFAGATVKGSDLGRAYTAWGLQQRKGVDYLPERDAPATGLPWNMPLFKLASVAKEEMRDRSSPVLEGGIDSRA